MRACASPRSPRCQSCPNISSGRCATRPRHPKARVRRSMIRCRSREWIHAYGAGATLSALHALITRTREREQPETSARLRSEWLQARGACASGAGQARQPASRSTTCARRSKRPRAPLPQSFLSTATAIGDASCLEPLARAWAAAGKDLDWNHQLSTTAATIMRREKLTGRSAAVKKLRANFPGFI